MIAGSGASNSGSLPLMRIVRSTASRGRSARITSAVTAATVTTPESGYSFVTNTTAETTDVYDSSNTWEGQFNMATTGSSGLPIVALTDGTTTYQCAMADFTLLATDEWVTVGDFTVYQNSTTNTTTVKSGTQTTVAAYDSTSGVATITFADGSSTQLTQDQFTNAGIVSSTARQHPSRIDPTIPGCNKLWWAVAAAAAAIVAAIAAYIACALAATYLAFMCKIAFDRLLLGLLSLLASSTAIYIAHCNVPITPAPSTTAPQTTAPQTAPPQTTAPQSPAPATSPPVLPSPPTPSPMTPAPHSPLPASPVPN
jgi:hypothetical protein